MPAIPDAAISAAAAAYRRLTPQQQRDPTLVATCCTTAALPYLGAALRSVGRTRIRHNDSLEIFKRTLRGATATALAAEYGVTRPTIAAHVARHMTAMLSAVDRGVRYTTLARRFDTTEAAIETAVDHVRNPRR